MGDAGKLWAVIQREYLERVRTRWFVIATVLGPVFFATLLFLPTYLASRSSASDGAADIVILDATNAGLGERVRALLRSPAPGAAAARPSGTTQLRVVAAGGVAAAERAAAAEVVAKRTQGYLLLDGRALRGDSAFYSGRNATSRDDTRRLETVVRQAVLALRLERAGLDSARIDSLTRPRLRLAAERLSEEGRGGSGAASLVFAVGVAFLLYTSIIIYGQNVLRSVIEEKQTRVAEVVISSIRPTVLLAGKVIGVGAVGLTQQVIWLGTTVYIGSWIAPVIARMSAAARADGASAAASAAPAMPGAAAVGAMPSVSPGAIGLILLFFLLGYLFYSALYAAVGSTVNSEQEAQQAAGPVVVLIVSSAALIQPALMNPGGALARTASLVPFSAPIIMPMRMSLVSVPPGEMAASIAGLVVACAVVVWLAARIYRVGLLMYGKRPTLREIARWARYAR